MSRRMSRRWLVLDCDYICNRAFYSMPPLDHNGRPTEVIYGFLRELVNLQRCYSTFDTIFCFDCGEPFRKKLLPCYKEMRSVRDKHHASFKKAYYRDRTRLHQQIEVIRYDVLPRLGYQNVFYEEGFEADDIIASVCQNRESRKWYDEMIIVSSDQDLYQLLTEHVIIWNPAKQECVTANSFLQKYGIAPVNWAHVKAISGCRSDGIPGIPGIGIRLALSYLTGRMKEGSDAYNKITNGLYIRDRNYRLVRLPLENTPVFFTTADEVTGARWRKVMTDLGIDVNDPVLRRVCRGQAGKERESV